MDVTLASHIIAGTIGLVAGYVALIVSKGAPTHRRSGMVFFYAMLAMALGGLAISIGRNIAPVINVPSAVLAGYLTLTGFTTVRERTAGTRRLDVAGMLIGFALALGCVVLAVDAGTDAEVRRRGLVFPLLMFGTVSAIAAARDVRVLRDGPPKGVARLKRHLWRMCFALFIASLAFFIGQADVFPEPIRIRPLLALPVPAMLVVIGYWFWRLRARRSPRALAGVTISREA